MEALMCKDQMLAGCVPKDPFLVEEKTVWPSLVINANTSTAVQTYSLAKTGYKVLGIIGFRFDGSNGNCCTYSKLTVSSDTLTYLVANNGSSNATVNCIVQVLYMSV